MTAKVAKLLAVAALIMGAIASESLGWLFIAAVVFCALFVRRDF